MCLGATARWTSSVIPELLSWSGWMGPFLSQDTELGSSQDFCCSTHRFGPQVLRRRLSLCSQLRFLSERLQHSKIGNKCLRFPSAAIRGPASPGGVADVCQYSKFSGCTEQRRTEEGSVRFSTGGGGSPSVATPRASGPTAAWAE